MTQAGSASDGGYRKTGEAAHGDPPDRAGHGAGGTDAGGAAVPPGPGAVPLPAAVAGHAVEPAVARVPYAGIRVGELIGYRLWWIIEGALCSLAHRRLWKPGETISGDINTTVRPNSKILGGVYAFVSPDKREADMASMRERVACNARMAELGISFAMLGVDCEAFTFVAGTICMWGEVVEHEHGYRAQFAKVRSLDDLHGPGDLAALRRRYVG